MCKKSGHRYDDSYCHVSGRTEGIEQAQKTMLDNSSPDQTFFFFFFTHNRDVLGQLSSQCDFASRLVGSTLAMLFFGMTRHVC